MLAVSKRDCSKGMFQFEIDWLRSKLNRSDTSRFGNG
jgi:hypothetical protein